MGLQLVFNLTRRCPYACDTCVMAATPDQTSDELEFKEKVLLLEEIRNIQQRYPMEVDFSGGELRMDPGNLEVIRLAARTFPFSVSTTGWHFTPETLKQIEGAMGVDFTLDSLPGEDVSGRPPGFNGATVLALETCARAGMTCNVTTVLTARTAILPNLMAVYHHLASMSNVRQWLLLPFYPNGRGRGRKDLLCEPRTLERVRTFARDLDAARLKVKLQHTLTDGSVCQAGRKVIGILPDGTFLACPWAVADDPSGSPLYLGRFPEVSLAEALRRGKELRLNKRVCQVRAAVLN